VSPKLQKAVDNARQADAAFQDLRRPYEADAKELAALDAESCLTVEANIRTQPRRDALNSRLSAMMGKLVMALNASGDAQDVACDLWFEELGIKRAKKF
jgi:hypothetical protein